MKRFTTENDTMTTALIPTETNHPLDIPAETFKAALTRRQDNRSVLIHWVRSALVEGSDFGRIPTKRGPSKPSLWKPGAEKICGMLGVTASFPTLGHYEQAALSGVELATIVIRCELQDARGQKVADGVGARAVKQDFGDLNKALKMAEKSAMIDATLRLAGLSEVFTQDLEDMPQAEVEPAPAATKAPTPQITPATAPEVIISEQQHRLLEAEIRTIGLDRERVKSWVNRKWGVTKLANLPARYLNTLLANMKHWASQTQQAA
ncbi:ERF superfamily protein [Gammaproteobacteria bacterium]